MFSEGLAGVRIDGRYGFIDEAGTLVIAPRFDLVGSFHLGLAEILIGDATGVIDRSGKVVLEPRFARAIPFTKDLILAQEGRSRRRAASQPDRGILHRLRVWVVLVALRMVDQAAVHGPRVRQSPRLDMGE